MKKNNSLVNAKSILGDAPDSPSDPESSPQPEPIIFHRTARSADHHFNRYSAPSR